MTLESVARLSGLSAEQVEAEMQRFERDVIDRLRE
jgi:hypothetical protein